jgi:predicted metal-binding membrane protein
MTSSSPTRPGAPADPSRPGAPADPNRPGAPADPNRPAAPADPSRPGRHQEIARPAAVAVLGLAGLAWWLSVARMRGMDDGPTVALGALGWFAATWLLMMAAMMLPAMAPVVATECFPDRRRLNSLRPVVVTAVFLAGYLAVWAVAGAGVYLALRAGRDLVGGVFEWHRAGQWLVAGVLAAATAYQLTTAKRTWLARCRAPLDGPDGQPIRGAGAAARAGGRAGTRCLASSWALMAALFALGVMSLIWMALVAVLIAAERLTPLASPARVAAAVVLFALAVGVAAAPGSVPGLTVPGSPAADRAMTRMSGTMMDMPARDHAQRPISMSPCAARRRAGPLDRPRCSR